MLVIRLSDTKIGIYSVLKDKRGKVIDLTDCEVMFMLTPVPPPKPITFPPVFNPPPSDPPPVEVGKDVTILDHEAGKVLVDIVNDYELTIGRMDGRYKVTFPGGREESFPSTGPIPIEVKP